MRVILVVPLDYESVGGYYLPINHYMSALTAYGYEVNIFRLPYHLIGKSKKQKYVRIFSEMYAPDVKAVIPFGLNQCTILIDIVDIKEMNNCIAFMIDCMRLHAESVLPYKASIKEWFRTLLRKLAYTYRERKCMKTYSEVIMVSRVDTEYAKEYYRSRRAKINYIPNGIEIVSRTPASEKKVCSDENILVFGCLTGFSNDTLQENLFPLLKEIFPFVHSRFNNTKIVIAGRGCKPDVKKVLDTIDGVEFIGEVESLREFYSKVDIIVTTVRKKCGIINRILEAWSYGKPVIGYESNFATFEYATSGKEYLVANNKQEFASKIKDIFSGKIDVYEMGMNGMNLVRNHYTWEKSTDKLIQIIMRKESK